MNLHQAIADHFQLADMRTLCSELSIDYENVKGENKIEKVIDLIANFRKNGRLPALQTYLQNERPAIDWPPLIEAAQTIELRAPAKDVPIQLPMRPEYFTGREAEIEALRTHLYPGRMVTLWAAGGMGKTTIAAETLYRLQDERELLGRFPDGVIFFSFYGRSQNEELYQHIIRTFNPEETKFTFENCFRTLSGKKLLLIYDGSEEAADLKQLIELQGQNGLLITTRDRRSYGGERIEVGLLPMAEAKQVLQDWSQGSVNEAEAQAICEEIGRLPLAVRIAGFYLDESGETAVEYLEMLQETPIRELSLGESQYESVEILLKRTVDKLDETTRLVLSLMGHLALLPFGPEPLTAVVGQRELRGALNQLNRYGLILREGKQIQLTHALIHRYARRRLSLDQSAFVKLLQFYEQIVRTESEKGPEGFQVLHAHRPHIMVVLTHCEAHQAWHDANALVQAMAAEQGYLELQGFNQIRAQMSEFGVQAARQSGNRKSEATHFSNLGFANHTLGQVEQAIGNFEQSLTIARELDDLHREGAILSNLGLSWDLLGEVERAITYFKKSLHIVRELGDRQGEVSALSRLGGSYRLLGKIDKAIEYLDQAISIAREIGDRQGEGTALGRLGGAYRELGEIEKVIECLEESLRIAHEIGDRRSQARYLCIIGIAYCDLGQLHQGVEFFEQSLTIAREVGDRYIEGIDVGNLGITYQTLGSPETAMGYLEQALAMAREIGDRQNESTWLNNLGDTYRTLGEVEKAMLNYEQSLAIAREIGARKNEGAVLASLGNAYSDLGHFEEAKSFLEQALTIAHENGYRKNEAEHAWDLGLLYKQSNPTKAVELMSLSVEYKKEIDHPDAEADAQLLAEIVAKM